MESTPEISKSPFHVKNFDSAERGIKLISDYADSLTKDNEERERILQLVQAHRQKIKKVTKVGLFQ